jgi:sugar phosphate isomerase/epimerase
MRTRYLALLLLFSGPLWALNPIGGQANIVKRDVLAKAIKGAEISIFVGVLAALLATAIGTALGAFSGFLGGRIGDLLEWVYNVFTSIPGILLIFAFAAVFGPLARRAEDRGVRIAFENCEKRGTWLTGDWNIAHAPDAWDAIFAAVDSPALGLEWEPCHQLLSFADPLLQIRRYAGRIWHIHGKDATILWDVVRRHGIRGAVPYAAHRLPGFGDTDWGRLIGELRTAGWRGSIDIEGFHDAAFCNALETTGQVASFRHLHLCRGGTFVPNPF